MSDYRAPLRDIRFNLEEVVDLAEVCTAIGNEDCDPEIVSAILEEAGRLCGEEIAPLNHSCDQAGAGFADRAVTAAPGLKGAYQHFIEGGWGGLSESPEFGGQGLPKVLSGSIQEMTQSANLAFSLCPMLSQGCIEAITLHASDEIKNTYLPKLVTGEWTGTMNLTEPQAGSDLAAIRTKAEPDGDGYRIFGQKIFITWGDHDMTDNIIHLVLARLPDAPAGVKGISLFVVPKYLVNEDGSLGERNDAYAASIEHKMGIHASPTCVMAFGDDEGAMGYLVGEPHNGLVYMFSMMNNARLGVGMQGVAISERAYQQAVEYAKERVQGMTVSGQGGIVKHPDVRRMLMTMRAATEASRSILYTAMAAVDEAHAGLDAEAKARANRRVALLTPVAKGWATEMSLEVTSLGVQVHGGMGFIEETGAAQHQRDARILPIYEGTTGIQAADLIGRKYLRDNGVAMTELLEDIKQDLEKAQQVVEIADITSAVAASLTRYQGLLEDIKSNGQDAIWVGSTATNFMMLSGYVWGAWLLMKSAAIAAPKQQQEPFYRNKVTTARVFCEQLLPRAEALALSMSYGAGAIMDIPEEEL
ncbi:alkylation response protein AidB-like acyl-CoA dehydrogenase [Sinobacterium caligoides]|uniref:3-methylmercaptopropionyl-CoA dehydrogenase n=1 Tax=Sinobacterium caligoides TaxID=933926 RepID=A0A3N2DQM3_9GAMM|nr:acyl-CoA dehydrogenase [Sinobacterium caligoides]ROS01605.1 alkylation response protein AidB-like acyl-CoA dehydrogenase [Sinobacterium caligoides]